MVRAMRGEEAFQGVDRQVRVRAAEERGDLVGVREQFRHRSVLARLVIGCGRVEVALDSAPVPGEQGEQLVRGRLAVERLDGAGYSLCVCDHLSLRRTGGDLVTLEARV